MIRALRAPIAIVVAATMVACASSGAGSAGTRVRHSPNVITAEELATVDVANAYQAVQRLRPQFLTASRGPTERGGAAGATDGGIQVYLDDTHAGDVRALTQIPVSGIKEIRFLTAIEATQRYGTGNSAGAIVVSRMQ